MVQSTASAAQRGFQAYTLAMGIAVRGVRSVWGVLANDFDTGEVVESS